MADVVRNGAIFRVKNPATMRSPMPRLPNAKLPRGRIAVATPEVPGATGRGQLEGNHRPVSALESVVSRPQTHKTSGKSQQQNHSVTGVSVVTTTAQKKRSARKRKKSGKPTTLRTTREVPVGETKLLSDFDRIVGESAMRKDVATNGNRKKNATMAGKNNATTEDTSSEETAASPQHERKGRKRQRMEPDEEGEPSGEDEDEEGEGNNQTTTDEMVTPQRRAKDESEESNDEDNEDGVRVQKRLMYDDTPPAKAPVAKKVAVRATKRKPSKQTPSSSFHTERRLAVAGSALEAFSTSSAPTPQRSTRIRTGVLVLTEWYVEWPPPFVADELQLVLHGQVLGQPMMFSVQRRVTGSQFVSTDNENVRLDGCLDIERAQQADVPPKVMELLVEGIPTHWRHRLEAFAPPPDPMIPLLAKSNRKDKSKAPAKVISKPSIAIPGVTKPTKSKTAVTKAPSAVASACGEPVTPVVEKRSRSGRRLTPVMEWWRNERKVTTAAFETKILEGSPAYLPSKRGTSGDSPEASTAAQAARQKIQAIWDAKRQSAEWSDAQVKALTDAKVLVPTTDPNFWAQVASHVPGKSADECRTRGYEELTIAPARKTGGQSAAARAAAAAGNQVPVKIHRAGSNLFKKQVRQFVHDLEQKNVDDLFSLGTPSKAALAGAAGLDDLQSPGAPLVDNHRPGVGDDSDEDALPTGAAGGGRELLEKVSMNKRNEVDSYVRTLKRGNDALGVKAVRMRQTNSSSATGLTTPPVSKKPRREGAHMTTEVGGRMIQCIVTPGGTTRVRIEKNSDAEDEEEQDEEDEDEAALSDGF